MKKSYFYIRKEPSRTVIQGTQTCLLGHMLEAPFIDGRPQGSYVHWSFKKGVLTVINDHYATFPLYYYWHDNEFCLSSSLSVVLKKVKNKALDHKALAVFFRLGFFIGNDTPFEHIRALPPKAQLKWEKGILSVQGDYTIPQPAFPERKEAIDRFMELFRKGIHLRLPDAPFATSLSGGFDSRLILLELLRMGCEPAFCITTRKYPPSTNEDVDVAKRVAQNFKLKHVIVDHKLPRFVNELRNLDITNYCADEHSWILETADYVKDKVEVLYDGIAGGTLMLSDPREEEYAKLMQAGQFEEAAAKILLHWYKRDEKTFQIMLTPDLYKKVNIDCAKEHLANELRKHAQAPSPFVSFNFWNRSRREIALSPNAVFSGVKKVYCPFLDYTVAQYLLSLPMEILGCKTFRKELVKRVYPQYEHLPFENDSEKDSATALHRGQFIRSLAWHMLQNNLVQSRAVNMSYLRPRLFRSMLSRRYAQKLWWVQPQLVLYLLELEKLQNSKVPLEESSVSTVEVS